MDGAGGMDLDGGGDDESSSSYCVATATAEMPTSLDGQLEQFRTKWKEEIRGGCSSASRTPGGELVNSKSDESSKEARAKEFFLQGVQAEMIGSMNEAINFYRKAIMLVPDIESKIEDFMPDRNRARQESESSASGSDISSTTEFEEVSNIVEPDEDDFDIDNLVSRFHRLGVTDKNFCSPEYEPTGAHISDLPIEVLMYIIKWVVSDELDMRMLEQLAKVSRGFYLFARDEHLWMRACKRIWGVNCGRPREFGSYRSMYICRPHVHCNGVYINRMTYIRHGEQGLEPGYQPVYLIEYFRFFRFFANGACLMITSADEPSVTVQKLRNYSLNDRIQGLMFGHYKLAGDTVTIVLKRHKDRQLNANNRYRRFRRDNNQDESEQIFHIELTISSRNSKHQHTCLIWNHYSVQTINKTTGQETMSEFELKPETYPMMYFSRVKSYTATTNSILD
ncbi:F-box only protein 9-like [Tubulanus polymorphus]|uniref:F-box only protein 9-like n=1 Tax=Tubulanus polymorphus TaxID=672921 RepID=UPI003DA38B2B